MGKLKLNSSKSIKILGNSGDFNMIMVYNKKKMKQKDEKVRFQPAVFAKELNARYPWLKIVLLILFVGLMALGVEEVLRHNVWRPAEVTQEETPPAEQEGADESTTAEAKPAEDDAKQAEDATETKPEEKPAEPVKEQQPKPAAPAVTKPQPVKYDTSRKLIALTFDDGPSSKTTPRLLQILAAKGVKATFFVVGTQARQNPGILKQEVAAGHEVGSHTMNHANLVKLGVGDINWQTSQMDALFQEYLGTTPKIMRPPYGSVNATVRQTVPQPMILWTIDPEDWKYRNAQAVHSKVVGAAFDGAIVLMHDIHSTTVDAVAAIIDDLRARGYEFLTVSELAAARGVVLQPGVAYGSFRP